MRNTVTLFVPEGYASGEDFAKDCGFEIAKPEPAPWDAAWNRYYEPVEVMAAEIYAAFQYPRGEQLKPGWVPHGNSMKQDEARDLARRELRKAGHTQCENPRPL